MSFDMFQELCGGSCLGAMGVGFVIGPIFRRGYAFGKRAMGINRRPDIPGDRPGIPTRLWLNRNDREPGSAGVSFSGLGIPIVG